MLAGNVFDWGAKEVALLMEESSLVIFFSYLDQTEIIEFNRMTLSVYVFFILFVPKSSKDL
jgi:hypothetical protein